MNTRIFESEEAPALTFHSESGKENWAIIMLELPMGIRTLLSFEAATGTFKA